MSAQVMKRIDHAGNVALRKVGNPPGFTVCGWTALDDGGTLYRMKFNPKPGKWTGDEKLACVLQSELDAEHARYETETGNCFRCDGSGQEWAGWDHKEGNRYRPCRRCNATGMAPQKQVATPYPNGCDGCKHNLSSGACALGDPTPRECQAKAMRARKEGATL